MRAADDPGFAALADKISAGVGLTLDIYKHKCLRRRVAARMRACGVENYADYGAVLDRSPEELTRLKDALTINVTRFYRNAGTWEALRATVVPALAQDAGGPCRVWSAGCASGEEAYTVVMLFADHLERMGAAEGLGRITVDATDIDDASLADADVGHYRAEALTELPADYRRRYFVFQDDRYRIVPAVRERVRFARHELSTAPPPRPRYHLILCRNVIIYFDRPAQERLLARFAEALVPGGYLVLGKVEMLLGPARARFTLADARERIYRRSA